MKRLFAILLVLGLVLCGCDTLNSVPTQPNTPGQSGGEYITNPTQSGGATAEPTRPAEAENLDYAAPALKVTVTINPELELMLNEINQILAVTALNADAEHLLAGMDLVEKPYNAGMTAILEEAKEQGFLKEETKISISASGMTEGADFSVNKQLLQRPVTEFQKAAGITLNCEIAGAEDTASVIARTHTNYLDGYQVVICYNAGGQQVMNKYIYDNGDYQEVHYSTGETFLWGNDGTFSYWYGNDSFSTEYTEHPDGFWSTATHTYDAKGNKTWSYYTQAGGISTECFYENGQSMYDIVSYSDGLTVEYFYENGELRRTVTKKPDGTVSESTPGGSSQEGDPQEGSKPQTADPEGTEYFETYYENGNLKTSETRLPNGDYEKVAYHENGERASVIHQENGYYAESYYDEQGNRISGFSRDEDGYEERSTYYSNGNRKTSERTWPNGDYWHEIFYENGKTASIVADTNGDYWENYYDEKGNLTKMIREDENGNKVEVPVS